MKEISEEADTIETLLARSTFYHGLSVLWRHPDTQTPKWLAMQEHHRLPEIVQRVCRNGAAPLLQAVGLLVKELDSVAVAQWAHQYERTFGHSVQAAAAPYELEYGQEHEHRQPQELGDIAAFYQAFGLRVSSQAHERVDHIVTECEFMQVLLYKQACAMDESHEEQAELCETAARQFLADHLGRWGPAFCVRLSRVAGSEVLGTIAEVTLAWLMEECARMRVSAGSMDLPLRLPKEMDKMDCSTCLCAPREEADGKG